jgi:hypothetical protein
LTYWSELEKPMPTMLTIEPGAAFGVETVTEGPVCACAGEAAKERKMKDDPSNRKRASTEKLGLGSDSFAVNTLGSKSDPGMTI